MSGFLDFNSNEVNYQTNNLLPAGTYEMVINSVEVRASQGNGHEFLSFDLIVRKDLDKVQELKDTNAKQHGRHLFASVYTLKDDQGEDSGKYDPRVLKHILKVAGVQSQSFNSIVDYINSLFNKPVRVSVSVRENEYKGAKHTQNSSTPIYFKKGEDKPSYIGWYQTKYPFQASVEAKLAQANPAPTDTNPFAGNDGALDESDLPF